MLETIKWVAIIVAVALILVALIKSKQGLPVFVVLLCIAWAGAGLYSGITCYQYSISQSKLNGTPEVHDPYEDFDFYEYSLNDIAWYKGEDGTYYYTTTYKASIEFNGNDNYWLLLNDRPATTTNSTNGRLKAECILAFRDIDGQDLPEINLEVNFAFYSSEIDLSIYTNAGDEEIKLLREYININGFNLRIINAVYTPTI